MTNERKRAVAARILAALPFAGGCRGAVLPIMLRRVPDRMLANVLVHVRREVRSQRRFLSFCIASGLAR